MCQASLKVRERLKVRFKPTTGVLLLARNVRSARNISRLFRNREIKKTYLALVDTSGSKVLKDQDHGSIRQNLTVDEEGRVNLHSRDSREFSREAHTDWEILDVSARIF